jgi:twitching motility protein PilT
VTGPTGSGKSTTMASMIDAINEFRAEHILTIEDPIEYIFKNKKSIISQRGVGRDTISFNHAIRSAMREDADIIMIDEIRDAETMEIALSLAETGHFVISTLHTS